MINVFQEGIFPNPLKPANVCPISKTNDKNKCENYLPISLLSDISKLFQKAMDKIIYTFLGNTMQFYAFQLWLKSKYSTNHALLSIIEKIKDDLETRLFRVVFLLALKWLLIQLIMTFYYKNYYIMGLGVLSIHCFAPI